MGNVYFLDSLTRIHQYQLKLIWQQSIREMTVTQGQVPCSNNQVSILRVRVRACVRACVCVCVWRRVTCLFHGIKEQLKTEKMWQTIPILFDYHTNFSFSCLVLNLQWHNQTIAVYQIFTIKQVHQFSKQFFTVHFFNKALSTTVTFSTHLCEQNCFGKTDDPVIDTKSSRLAGESLNNQ